MRRWSQLSSAKRRQITALVFEAKGRTCQLRLLCNGDPATTVDHIIPDSAGGSHTVANLEPACKPCNSSRQDRATGDGRYGARTVVVTGPPAAGKSTYVMANAAPTDVVIDLDRIATALMPAPLGDHEYPDHVRHVAIGARTEAIWRATRLREPVTVWLIHSVPSPQQMREYRRRRFTIQVIDPGEQVVRERAERMRPTLVKKAIDAWYEKHESPTPTPASRPW